MLTLAQQLGTTAPLSPLLRKARRCGIETLGDAMALAFIRGCKHYPAAARTDFVAPLQQTFSNQELVILLLLGENQYEPMAIRCAAQLARSPEITATGLARLAHQSVTVRTLAHIAHAGLVHDSDGRLFWEALLAELQSPPLQTEPFLPHWSRFVSQPGYQGSKMASSNWFTPSP